jgi:hypothetical protein
MRLAVFDSDGLVENVYSGDPTSIANLKSLYENHLEIADDVEINFDIPFYVKDGKLEQPELSDSEKHARLMIEVREQCRMILQDSDKWMLPDAPNYISSKLDAWKTYRQSIRDLPSTIGTDVVDISKVTFPDAPSST